MTKINHSMIESIASGIEAGLQLKEAASCCNVSYRTVKEWKTKGKREPDSIFGEFVARLEVSDGAFERAHLENIARASQKQWQASAWLLERTRPDKYALIKRVETGKPGDFDKLTDDELNATILELVPRRHPKRKMPKEDIEQAAG